MAGCGCGCDDNVQALQGSQGNDGTSTVLSTSSASGVAAVHYMYTVNRTNASSDNISGAGYQWSVLTVPAVPASNVLTFSLGSQINATDVHIVTVTVLKNGSPVANLGAVRNQGTKGGVSWRFQDSNASQGDAYIINFVSDTGGVTPTLTGANVQIDIWG